MLLSIRTSVPDAATSTLHVITILHHQQCLQVFYLRDNQQQEFILSNKKDELNRARTWSAYKIEALYQSLPTFLAMPIKHIQPDEDVHSCTHTVPVIQDTYSVHDLLA